MNVRLAGSIRQALLSGAAMMLIAALPGGAQGPRDAPPTEFQLMAGETKALFSGELSVCFEGVLEDSRCPRNALCIRAGNGKVSLTASQGRGAPLPLTLNTHEEPRSGEAFGHEVFLVRLDPLREVGQTVAKDSYAVTLRVRKIFS